MEATVKKLIAVARRKRLRVATVESCTGGLVAKMITDVPGASDVFEQGLVTYSNEAKMDLAGVPHALLKAHGAVSEEVARAMAEGAVRYGRAHMAVSLTGIAGPGGGTKKKPVGLVYIALARKKGQTQCLACQFSGSREVIRRKAAEKAIQFLLAGATNRRLSS